MNRTVLLPALALSALALAPIEAFAGRLEVTSATASSTYAEGNYTADKAIDGKQTTSWVEGDGGAGLGAYLTLEFGEEVSVTGLKVWAGDWYDEANWMRANRPQQLELKFSDGSTEMIDLKDEMAAQKIELPTAHKTTSVRVRLKAAYNGTTWLDTVLSEIQFFGEGGKGMPVKGWSASSEHTPDGDGNYVAGNAGDGLVDSMWCEGTDGDGTGEWLQVDFTQPLSLSSLTMINGVGSSLGLWMKSNRTTAATLTFSDGSTAKVDLKPSIRPSTVTFPAVTTSSVRITADTVTKGKEYNDLCFSEVVFK